SGRATPSSRARLSMYVRSSSSTPPVAANTVCTFQPRSFSQGTQKLVSRPPEKARTMSLDSGPGVGGRGVDTFGMRKFLASATKMAVVRGNGFGDFLFATLRFRLNDDARLDAYREIDGIGNEAGLVRILVRGPRLAGIAAGGKGNHGMQHHFGEAPAVAGGFHAALGGVLVGGHHHAGNGGHVQVR